MSTIDEVKQILATALQLGDRVESWGESQGLLGVIPELDSMAVVTVLTSIEDHYGFIIDDDEISGETFETLGALTRFVEEKASS